MESSLVTALLLVTISVLEIKELKAQDPSNACDVNQPCSCCVSEEDCLASHEACDVCSSAFLNYECLGTCDKYGCSNNVCEGGYCRIPCKDGYWGGRCIRICPDNCVSCHQHYKKTNECFECVPEKYGMNCSHSCSIKCADAICDKTNGSCLNCNQGYYGDSCSNECPDNCANTSCEKLTGECFNCEPGYYGKRCSSQCPKNCANCEKTSGICLSCKQGYYGNSCFPKCPDNCGNDRCNMSTGTCLRCEKGYYGHNCSGMCPIYCPQGCDMISGYCDSCTDGYHGNKCEIGCPSNCVSSVCFQDNGTCSEGCKPNFQGDMCTKCKPGKYGEDCSQICSPGCKNGICDKQQGNCTFGCKFGFSDSQFCCSNSPYCATCSTIVICTMCLNDTYGSQCESRCPDRCNGTCDMHTGTCTSCLAGFYGETCDIDCNSLCRNSICDMSDGKCTYGCINNSTTIGCKEENSTRMSGDVDDAKEKDSLPTGAIIGSAFASLALLLTLFSLFFLRRYCQNKGGENVPTVKKGSGDTNEEDILSTDYAHQSDDKDIMNDNDINNDADINNDGHADADGAEMHETNRTVEQVINPYENERRNVSSLTGVTLDKLQDLFSKPHEAYQNEFKMLPMGLIKPHNDACKPDNMKKNRYNAVYPYDENRVKVASGQFDYINASYINGFEKSHVYIAALGPTEKTIGDFAVFWKMAWQEKVEVIVMLTRLVESSGMKCDQYWPDNGTTITYGEISIKCECEDVYAEFTARQFTMTLKKQRRHLHHIQFTAWPDKGVPDDIISIINLRQRISKIGCRFDGPVLVHCSAGIGRTGTYIALDILSKQGSAENTVDVFKCVFNLRQQRVSMVQTLEQYKFIHYAVAWTFMVDIQQFLASSFKELSWVDDQLQDMYKILQLDIFQETDEETTAVESNRANTYANRENSDIPGYRHNVTLWPDGEAAEATGYINAVYIDGFKRRNRFIAAQTPMPGTVSDFLKMILQRNPSCTIDLEPSAENREDVGKYLPAANQSFQEGSHMFRVTGLEKRKCYTKRTIEVSSKRQPSSMARTMEHFSFTEWPECSTLPDDAIDIVDLIQDVETTLKNSANEGPIIVHCLNGAIRSGLLCGVWLAIERLEHEQTVNVLNTLRQVKYRRRQTIVNKEQLQFCFECVSTYVNRLESQVYSNQ